MRSMLAVVLSLTLVGQTSALFSILGGIINGIGHILDFGLTSINKMVDTGVRVGGNIIGSVVDPFGIWKTSSDDHGHNTRNVSKCPAIADIIFVLDTSSSMQQNEFELEKLFAIRLTEHFQIGPNDVRFGAVVFSDSVQKVFGLADFSDHSSLKTALSMSPFLSGGTKTYLALDYIRNSGILNTASGGRIRSSKMVIVITDGSSDSLFTTSTAAQALKNQGITVLSVGIGSGLGVELFNIASGPRNVFQADSFDSLTRIEQRVARKTCQIPQSAGHVPSGRGSGGAACQTGFTQNPSNRATCIDVDECASRNTCQQLCVNQVGSFRCVCRSGFVVDATDTSKCKELGKCQVHADIICVLDASGSIGSQNFALQLNFVSKLASHFRIGRVDVLFGAVIFSTNVQKLFDLKTYSSQADVSQALLEAPYLMGGTNTHKALNYIRKNELFSVTSGGRPEAVDLLIVLTDGISAAQNETTTAATRLKQQGVHVISVGVGDQISTQELVQMASSSQDVYVVAEFELLDYIEQLLTERACGLRYVDECTTNKPCDHVCTNTVGGYHCSCREGYEVSATDPHKCDDVDECTTNKPCDHVCTNTVGGYHCSCREGYEVSATDPYKCDDVDECTTNKPCDHVCTNKVGGYQCFCREGYEVSATDPHKCHDTDKCFARPCKQTCKNTIGGFNCSCREGYKVSPNDPTSCQDVNECTDKPCQQVCTNTPGSFKCSCENGFAVNTSDPTKCQEPICVDYLVADIYFLCDSSNSINGIGWGRALNFVVNVAKVFQLGPADVQIAFGIFSNRFKHIFDLNRFTSQDDLAQEVLSTAQLKQNTYTYDALNAINDRGLLRAPEFGARNVPKILITITDGQSQNITQTIAAAERIRKNQILTLSVGVGVTNQIELQGIAGSGKNVFSVKSFGLLDKIRGEITQRVCDAGEDPPAKYCPDNYEVDIVFLVDSAGVVGLANYGHSFEFIANLARTFSISDSGIKVALLNDAAPFQPIFNLTSSIDRIYQSLLNAPYTNSSDSIHLGLTAASQLLTLDYGAREHARKTVILITDSKSSDPIKTSAAAQQLKNNGITVISLGVGPAVDNVELAAIASRSNLSFEITDYSALVNFSDTISEVCERKMNAWTIDLQVADFHLSTRF